MAIRYFAEVAGQTVSFDRVDHRGATGSYGYHNGAWILVTRKVNYKAFASKHECDARCYNASGRTMNCECSCGGKNHGKGAFNCEAA